MATATAAITAKPTPGELPLCSRIVPAADAVSAITNNAMSPKKTPAQRPGLAKARYNCAPANDNAPATTKSNAPISVTLTAEPLGQMLDHSQGTPKKTTA